MARDTSHQYDDLPYRNHVIYVLLVPATLDGGLYSSKAAFLLC